MWSTYSSVPCKKNGANLPKSPEAQYLYHSLSLPLHLSFYLSLSISVSFKSRLQDSQLNAIEWFFVAQKALALTELSPSLSFACLTKMTNAGMRGTLRSKCVTTESFLLQLIWIAFLVDEVLIHHIRIGNCTQFTKTPNSSDRPLCSAPAVFGLIAFQRLAFSQRTLT